MVHHAITQTLRTLSLRLSTTKFRQYHVGKAANVNSAIQRSLRKSKYTPRINTAKEEGSQPPWVKKREQDNPSRLDTSTRSSERYESKRTPASTRQSRTEDHSRTPSRQSAHTRPPTLGRSRQRENHRDGRSQDPKRYESRKTPASSFSERKSRTEDHGRLPLTQSANTRPSTLSRPRQREDHRDGRSQNPDTRDLWRSSEGLSLLPNRFSASKSTSSFLPPKKNSALRISREPIIPSHHQRSTKPISDNRPTSISSHRHGYSDRHAKISAGADVIRKELRGPRSRAAAEQSSGPRLSLAVNKHVPLSIPYTTPASEFLYGTSVVEAALLSQREPRRKLYKLFVYKGDDRVDIERDDRIERLARKNGVEVVQQLDLRLMEKLSAGRPHNGYILEASPLPRLPVTSLGDLTEKEGQRGFHVVIGHQSREEAMVNGTDSFIGIESSPRSQKRCPLVLLLDGIVDPQNLGGIVRSASFLGASAIAIATRNSASFTPVVLKASAGASENVTIFSVSTPAQFVVESKLAGWKIFAGVPPAPSSHPDAFRSVSAHNLGDPLHDAPCILMLGGEGEGLRGVLRSKADVYLFVPGSGQRHGVDSLNVSVAAGILCSAFMSGKSSAPDSAGSLRHIPDAKPSTPGNLF